MLVVLYGPDGAGKSTLVDGLCRETEGVQVYHFSPLILPQRPVLHERHKRVVTGRPYGARPWSPWLSSLKLLYYAFDFFIFRILIAARSLTSSTANVIVFDRYFLDFKYDKQRNRLNLSDEIIVFFYKIFVPKPDIEFYVLGDAEVISARKNEITVSEAEGLLKIYRDAAIRCSGTIINTTENSADVCIRNFVEAINVLNK